MCRRAFPLILVLLAVSPSPSGAADPARPAAAEASGLVEQSFEAQKRGDALRDGWQAQYDRGIDLANRAIAADPGFADAYYALFVNEGRKADRAGLASKALAASRLKSLLDKTIELDPGHAHAWEARGELLLRLPRLLGGSTRDGEQALRRAGELAPRWAKPRMRLAELAWGRGQADAARAEAEAARDLARAAGDGEAAAEAEELLTKIASRGS